MTKDKEILDLLKQGLTQREICDKLNVHTMTVHRVAKRNNIQNRPPGFPKGDKHPLYNPQKRICGTEKKRAKKIKEEKSLLYSRYKDTSTLIFKSNQKLDNNFGGWF